MTAKAQHASLAGVTHHSAKVNGTKLHYVAHDTSHHPLPGASWLRVKWCCSWRPCDRLPLYDIPVTMDGATRQPSVQAQLSVRSGRAAINFYKQAFGARELYRFGGNDDLEEVVAQLAIGESYFWVEDESPPHGDFSPQSVGGATTRMLLVVDDPPSVVARVVAAGATEVNAVEEEHGWQLGRIDDPFGHRWEIARPTGDWPPPVS